MKRRAFITLLGGTAATWPLAARAQQSERMRRIGVLCIPVRTSRRHRPASPRSCKGSRKLGWAVGRNMRIDYRWSEAMPRACANMRQNWSRSVRRSPARRAALPIDLAMNARLQGQNV